MTVEDAILAAIAACGGKSICPTEAARLLGTPGDPESWRRWLSPVRMEAMKLADAGRIVILRKGRAVTGADVRGVIRLAGPTTGVEPR